MNRDVLRQDWRLTQVECTSYIRTLCGAQLITDPITQYGACQTQDFGSKTCLFLVGT